MTYRIIPTPEFIKQAKKLSKKYPNLPTDLGGLHDLLMENPKSGIHLGNNCYKIRLQNTSVKKGKSGGYRVITFLIDAVRVIRLLSIYSKSERDIIQDEDIKKILKKNKLI